MRIIISGLTAAGKTTHANILAEKYKINYFSASQILLDLYGINKFSGDFWVSDKSAELNKIRNEKDNIDKIVDKRLLECFLAVDSGIFDSWGLSWFVGDNQSDCLRVWLESDIESRHRKAIISNILAGENLSYDVILDRINLKDKQSRDYFMRNYDFDLYFDRLPFDLILDISSFIKSPTLDASRISIEHVDRILSSFIGMNFIKDDFFNRSFANCLQFYGKDVIKFHRWFDI